MTIDYLVVPVRLAAKYQRLQAGGYDPFADMTPKEAMMCRRLMAQRDRANLALAKWEARDVDNRKD